MTSLDLLIVDDEASLRDFLTIVFEGEGWHVDAAASLAEARARSQKSEPDLVLCDLMLPDGSGIDFLRELKPFGPMFPDYQCAKRAPDAVSPTSCA